MGEIIKRATIKNFAFWLCLGFSVGLITVSFFVPPTGVIDGSVLAAVGELFGFATLYVVYKAIEKGIDAKVTHNNTTIEINNDDDSTEV